jgi:hypothetical protein
MSLVRMQYPKPRRMGRTKALEQKGDWRGLLEHAIKLSEAHVDYETAAELRAKLSPQPMAIQIDTEPVYTQPEAKKTKPQQRKERKISSPSKMTPRQASDRAWEELRMRKGYDR